VKTRYAVGYARTGCARNFGSFHVFTFLEDRCGQCGWDRATGPKVLK
jgi:hypothetical protein